MRSAREATENKRKEEIGHGTAYQTEFRELDAKVLERLDRQDELLLSMKAKEKETSLSESVRLFDNQDLCMLLQISKRSLQRYRSKGALSFKVLGKRPITARRTC